MAGFDLERFRDLAFGRKALPDHPMADLEEAQKLIALIPESEPDKGPAEITHWASIVNTTESFTPGRRVRILMALDAAARPLWRKQALQYLMPAGRLNEGRDGDAGLLRALFDCSSEMANGFAI